MKMSIKKLSQCMVVTLLLNISMLSFAQSNSTLPPSEAQMILKSNGTGTTDLPMKNGSSGGGFIGNGGSGSNGSLQSENIPTRTRLPQSSNQNTIGDNIPQMSPAHSIQP